MNANLGAEIGLLDSSELRRLGPGGRVWKLRKSPGESSRTTRCWIKEPIVIGKVDIETSRYQTRRRCYACCKTKCKKRNRRSASMGCKHRFGGGGGAPFVGRGRVPDPARGGGGGACTTLFTTHVGSPE